MLFAAAIFSIAITSSSWTAMAWEISILLTSMALITSWIFLLIFKKWWKFLFSFIMGALTVAFFIYLLLLGISLAFNPGPDNFGKEHPIPAHLEYSIPLDEREELSFPIDSTAQDTWLQIWNDFQGGMYTYDFYYPALEEGVVFLRCYEATENIPLSSERISAASMVATPSTKIGRAHV